MTRTGPVTVVVAPDKFRGSLTATGAAAAIAAGLRDAAAERGVELILRLLPVADGGEGVVEAALGAGYAPRHRTVTGPTGEPVEATFAVDATSGTAVVELAAASGLALVSGGGDSASALGASTCGTGQLIVAALDEGVSRILLGVGGSATTDGGTGLAAVLGARFLDADSAELTPGGAALTGLDRIDVSGLDSRLADVEVVVACDVDNPLTGIRGAARVYAPQKGATVDDVAVLDEGLRRLAAVLRQDVGADVEVLAGAGAAGGVGGGAVALLGARLVPGTDVVLDLVGFDTAVAGADLVVTGEGSLDAQSLAGKAPVGVARRAAAHGVPVLFLAGRVDLDDQSRAVLADLGSVGVLGITDMEPDVSVAVRDAARLLRLLTYRVLVGRLFDLPACGAASNVASSATRAGQPWLTPADDDPDL